MPDPLAAAIAENARWCDRVGRASGIETTADDRRWWARSRMPPFHPDAVSLVPGLAAEDLLAGIDATPGASVKDAHADVDLAPAGFSVLLLGRWWHRPPSPSPAPETRWRVVVGPAADVVGGALLADPAVRAVTVTDDGRVRARAVLHDAGDVVGVSHLVAAHDAEVEAWRAVVGATCDRHLVGWDAHRDLGPVVAAGARPLGPLRVWARPER